MPFRIPKLRSVRVRVIIVMLFLIIYVLTTYIIVEKYYLNKPKSNTSAPKVEFEYVIVHLDLKGAPPKLSYLEALLPLLKRHGVNGLLIEYEDMFPYEEPLMILRGRNSYKKEQLHAYLTAAVSSGFEIIPLVQTFGHLEFALKHPRFGFFREDPYFPDSICPSSLKSQHFLEEMIGQIITFHRKIAPLKYIHVGCDEVFHINKCDLCQRRNLTNAELLTQHIKFLIETVHILSPDTTILIWDDLYRKVKPIDCSSIILTDTEVVHWDYTAKPHDDVHINLYKYGRMFDNLWIATAFKGADGRKRILPDLNMRFYNHFYWLNFIFDYGTLKNLYKIKGIILTGWSRYEHTAPLCEILPASIPSLIINLILIQKYTSGIVVENIKELDNFIDEHIENSLDSSLLCQNRSSRFLDIFDSKTCHYAESDLYMLLQRLSNSTSVAYSIIDDNAFKYFVLKRNASNNEESRIEYDYVDGFQTQIETCIRIFHELTFLEEEIIGLLSAYFENDVIIEYVRTKIRSLQQNIQGIFRFWNYRNSTSLNKLHK
ncbi:hexosaminidase D-like [Cydia pomonella]|uniref:hexosaminidase D-like n=1 Tax=Cydia pomonella TaxID=82600 RepID=UPI002ADDDEC2|nr:hexosaminidase D-like [Cydia pomonella]